MRNGEPPRRRRSVAGKGRPPPSWDVVSTFQRTFPEVDCPRFVLGLSLGIRKVVDVDRDPLFGGLYENLVIADILKARLNRGKDPGLYFIRDSKGVEIDLVVEDGRALDLYEIKSSASFSADFARNIEKYAELIPEVRNKRVIYSGKSARKGSVEYIPFTDEKV